MTDIDAFIRAIALLKFVVEIPKGSNAGPMVEPIQRVTGNKKGDSWCASLLAYVGSGMFGAGWKVPLTASCTALLKYFRTANALYSTPVRGDFFLRLEGDEAHHTGVVTDVHADGSFSTWEGNTNPGGSKDGYGEFSRVRGGPTDHCRYLFGRWSAA